MRHVIHLSSQRQDQVFSRGSFLSNLFSKPFGDKKPHPSLVISSGAHLGFDSQCGEFPQCDARRGYIQNIPFTGGMVKKIGDKTCISHLSGIQTPSDPG